jgi:hypothetical protein
MHLGIAPGWTGAVAVLDHAGALAVLMGRSASKKPRLCQGQAWRQPGPQGRVVKSGWTMLGALGLAHTWRRPAVWRHCCWRGMACTGILLSVLGAETP